LKTACLIEQLANSCPQVTDYLKKKGYNRTEEVFRQEVSQLGPDGRPISTRVEDSGPKKYLKAFNLLKDWVDNNLSIYKVSSVGLELNKPLFSETY
jgi:transcription initiation factor TFIID subunit 5